MHRLVTPFTKLSLYIGRVALTFAAFCARRLLLLVGMFLPFLAVSARPPVVWSCLGLFLAGGLVIWLKNACLREIAPAAVNHQTDDRPLHTLGLFLLAFLFLVGATFVVVFVTVSSRNRLEPTVARHVETDSLEAPTPLAISDITLEPPETVEMLTPRKSSRSDGYKMVQIVRVLISLCLSGAVLTWLVVEWANARRL